MASINVHVRLRPVKLAFVVDPCDKPALLEAVQINTFLWGGIYNPIVPAWRRRPRRWSEHPIGEPKAGEIVRGYIDAFDPDFVVPVGSCKGRPFDVGPREIISPDQILEGVEDDGTPGYGVGLFEVLQDFFDTELRFVRRSPVKVCLPAYSKRYETFMASAFGMLPPKLHELFMRGWAERLGAEQPSCSIANCCNLLLANQRWLHRLASRHIEAKTISSWRHSSCLFFLDATKSLDIIDYWNLRAVGWGVLPVPKQAAPFTEVRDHLAASINANYFALRHNPRIFHNTTVLKSRCTSQDEVRGLVDALGIKREPSPAQPRVVLQPWYPRMWDEWARNKDGVGGCDLDAGTVDYDFPTAEEDVTFRTNDPKVASRFGGHGQPRFANEVSARAYGSKELFAEVIPEGGQALARAIGPLGVDDWRFSTRGMVYLATHTKWRIHFSAPKADELMVQWFRDKGWEVRLSPNGLIAHQMLRRLGGVWGVDRLADKGLLDLLREMAGGKDKSERDFHGRVKRIANERSPFPGATERLLRFMLENGVVRLGLSLRCPICTQHSWYSVSEADYELQCPKCLETFGIPCHSPADLAWSYKTHGPFALPRSAYGAYSVLLTLRFFSETMRGASTPLLSFEARRSAKTIEADLCLLFQESVFGEVSTETVFAECKSDNCFGRPDVERMRYMAEQFPGATLAFATLRETLTEGEKRLLRPLVNRGRRYWKHERPYNPVLILTGTELLTREHTPECWKNIDAAKGMFDFTRIRLLSLLEVCDITQRLHLGMKPWHDWLQERWDRRARLASPAALASEPSSDGAES